MGVFFRRMLEKRAASSVRTPDGAWLKCGGCGEVLYRGQLEKNYFVCPKCSFHFRIPCTRCEE